MESETKMIQNAFYDDIPTHSIPEDEMERASEMYADYKRTEADEILESLPDDEHEPSSQYPMM